MRGSSLLVPAIAALHLAISGLLLLVGAGASLGALETGAEPPLLARLTGAIGRILLYPIFIPATQWLPRSSGAVGWTLLILNSVVWAGAAYLLLRIVRARRTGRLQKA